MAALPPRQLIEGRQDLEDLDLAGDVQVMRPHLHAGMCKPLAGLDEGPGAVEHHGYAFQRTGDLGRIVELEAAPAPAVLDRQRCQSIRTATGDDGLQAKLRGLLEYQSRRVAIGAIDQNRARHDVPRIRFSPSVRPCNVATCLPRIKLDQLP